MTDDREKILKRDTDFLLQRGEFRRFILPVIQRCGLFDATTDGSEGRHLAYAEGRRNLGLEILAMLEAAQPVSHPDGYPYFTLLQLLHEEAQQPTEKPNGRRSRYDRNRDLDDDGDGSDGSGG